MVQLQHLIEQVVGQWILDLAKLGPWDLFLLHFVGNQRPIPIFEPDFLHGIRAEEACQRDQVRNCEILNLRAIVERENGMSARAKGEEDYSTGPDIDGRTLRMIVKEGFRWHVSLGASSISDLQLLL